MTCAIQYTKNCCSTTGRGLLVPQKQTTNNSQKWMRDFRTWYTNGRGRKWMVLRCCWTRLYSSTGTSRCNVEWMDWIFTASEDLKDSERRKFLVKIYTSTRPAQIEHYKNDGTLDDGQLVKEESGALHFSYRTLTVYNKHDSSIHCDGFLEIWPVPVTKYFVYLWFLIVM